MPLRERDIAELATGLPLTLGLEPYRERLIPLATAVLHGESRRTVDSRRELVLPDAWDGRLHDEVLQAIGKLRGELTRKLSVLDDAVHDLEHPRKSALARAVIDRVLAELMDGNDKNIAALEELERKLESSPEDERVWRAAIAARGAFAAARIHPNETRRAIVRAARSFDRCPQGEDPAEWTARMLARTLATDERRAAVHEWAGALAEGGAPHVPLLAAALRELVTAGPACLPDDDLLWVQACIGASFEFGLGMS